MSELATIQRREALNAANRVRTVRYELKQQIRAERTLEASMNRAALVLETAPVELDTMRVETLLKAVYRFGPAKVNRMLAHAGIPLSRTVGALTRRQRSTLVSLMREYKGAGND